MRDHAGELRFEPIYLLDPAPCVGLDLEGFLQVEVGNFEVLLGPGEFFSFLLGGFE